MGNRIITDGVETVDGRVVELYDGKVVNAFRIEPDVGIEWCDGDMVAIMMVGRVETPKFSNIKKSGQVKKVIQFRAEEVVPMSADKGYYLIDKAASQGMTYDDSEDEQGDIDEFLDMAGTSHG